MLRKIIVTGGATLLLKLAYDGWISDLVPNQPIWQAMPYAIATDQGPVQGFRIDLDTDDLAFCGLVGVLLGTFEGFTRKVAPGA
jgi:hypothetical protein